MLVFSKAMWFPTGVLGNLELKMESGEREEMMHTSHSHSSDSQRSDEEGELKTGENGSR